MKKSVLFLLLILSLNACKKEEVVENGKPVVKIGVVLPLSGNMGFVGQGVKSAVLMAQEDLQKEDLKNNYEFVIEDDAFEIKRTAMIVNKFSNVDNVDAMISFSSQSGLVVSSIAERNKIAHISIGASDLNVSNGEYNFIHWTMPERTAEKMIEFYKKNNYKNIVAIVPNNAGSIAIYEAFENLVKNDKFFDLTLYKTQPNEKDFRILLQKVKRNNPDTVLSLDYTNKTLLFLKQYYEAGINAPLTNIHTFSTISDFSGINDVYYSSISLPQKEFLEEFNRKYPDAGTLAIGNIYDSVMLLVKAFEQVEDKSDVVKSLIGLSSYDGVINNVTLDEHGVFNSEASLIKIVNGQPVVVGE